VSLVWGAGESERQTIAVGKLSSKYATKPLRFRAGGSTDKGRLEIIGSGKGTFRIGTVSVMPADNIKGMRPDTLKLLKELNSPIYRWPGGNFASGYDWRDGIGDRDKRPPLRNPAWQGLEQNDFGFDEFMEFCREIGTEPLVTVNSGFGDDHSAVEEVEYANGSTETPMGRWRAENGHREPYGVKWWCIGNEMYGRWQLGYISLEQYVRKHNLFAKAMRKVDPAVKLTAVGEVGRWSEGMLRNCADYMDLISEHFYKGEKESVMEHVRQAPDAVRGIVTPHRDYRKRFESLKGKDIRIAIDEWNYWYGDHVYGELGTRYFMKDALGVAAGLHEMISNSDIVFMAN
jgi:alpha-N-arabinofuranosidase